MADDLQPAAPVATEQPAPTPEPVAEQPTPASGAIAQHEAALDDLAKRDEATGRYLRGTRHRARSQQASPDDVPRIAELTRRLHDAEAERDRLKAAPAPAASLTPAPSLPPVRPAASVPAAAAPVPAAKDDPEPDAGTYDDFSKWVRDHNRWAARDELRQASERYTAAEQQRAADAEAVETSRAWREKVAAAKDEYSDFQQVALDAPTPIPPGSPMDMWIVKHKQGARVLYHLQKNLTEAYRMLSLPILDQFEELTLLAQRLTPSKRTAAVPTAAVPAPVAQPVVRPPTAVRTGPHRTGDEPPSDDHSVSEHRKFWDPRRTH